MSVTWDQIVLKVLPLLSPLIVGLLWYLINKGKTEWAIFTGFAIYVMFGLIGTAYLWQTQFAETETSGVLRPANDPTPPNACGEVPKEALLLVLGTSGAWSKEFPHTVLRVAGQDLLWIDRKKGGITVSAKIFSSDSKIVAELEDNEFHLNPGNHFRRKRPDRHTLIVYDQHGRQVLYVRHINPTAIKLLGVFHGPSGVTVKIEEERLLLPRGNVFKGYCFGANKVSIVID